MDRHQSMLQPLLLGPSVQLRETMQRSHHPSIARPVGELVDAEGSAGAACGQLEEGMVLAHGGDDQRPAYVHRALADAHLAGGARAVQGRQRDRVRGEKARSLIAVRTDHPAVQLAHLQPLLGHDSDALQRPRAPSRTQALDNPCPLAEELQHRGTRHMAEVVLVRRRGPQGRASEGFDERLRVGVLDVLRQSQKTLNDISVRQGRKRLGSLHHLHCQADLAGAQQLVDELAPDRMQLLRMLREERHGRRQLALLHRLSDLEIQRHDLCRHGGVRQGDDDSGAADVGAAPHTGFVRGFPLRLLALLGRRPSRRC
mmetsp:Transcript_10113/g.35355  ORF Transcript_10113/g.35355 Transcript_10113/m.35355 type:complete len:314 (-) Transcript_10113:280-1221(-)